MTAENKLLQMAAKFMDKIHRETCLPVLIYDGGGRIVLSTKGAWIDAIHPCALQIIKEGKTEYVISKADAKQSPLVKQGYLRTIVYNGEKIGGFGLIGIPDTVVPVGRTAALLAGSWLDELSLYEEVEERVKERTLILKQEIDARRQAEKVLKENQARFEAFTKAIPDILFVFDRDGRYVEIFTFSQDLLYEELSQLKGKLIQDVLPPDVAALHHRIIRETSETGEIRHFEYELEVPKGSCWFESRTAPILGIDREKQLVASSVRDITHRKLTEKEISEKEKLSVVIETAGAVCHEFNQPLQIITGYCGLLKTFSGVELTPDVLKIIDKISQQARRMGKLNKNLMNITSYKTKTYLESKIIDIDKSSSE